MLCHIQAAKTLQTSIARTEWNRIERLFFKSCLSTCKFLLPILFLTGCVCSEEARDRSSEQHPKEECIYEVIPDGQQTTVTSVYATVNFPTNDPASLYYSTISFQTSSTENIDGEALVLKPSTSSCQYSVLKYSQSSTALTDPPTRSTDEPLYSAVKKPH
ncbi:hypothetical protein ATANTOWER_032604 [Ataeniobius toweri]|uniref:Uncharacterized protein n=1 Tax=Ataeniobius toweri TaxID=208326 RepID=A0ABU7B9U4_9TELE|nr:hypothetical protein [Ataeniobius toweri]